MGMALQGDRRDGNPCVYMHDQRDLWRGLSRQEFSRVRKPPSTGKLGGVIPGNPWIHGTLHAWIRSAEAPSLQV